MSVTNALTGDVVLHDSKMVQWTEAKPTAELRWSKEGVLQQLWIVRVIYSGCVNEVRQEWRDIPKEGE